MPYFNMRRQSARGFTIIELMVVIGIITLLMALLGAVLMKLKERTKMGATKTIVEKCNSAMELYHLNFRAYPPATAPGGLTGSQALYYYLTTVWRTNPVAANGEQWADVNQGPFTEFQATEFRKNGSGYDILDAWNTPLQYKINIYADSSGQVTAAPLIYSVGINKTDEHVVFRPGSVPGSGFYATTASDPNPNLNSDDIMNGN